LVSFTVVGGGKGSTSLYVGGQGRSTGGRDPVIEEVPFRHTKQAFLGIDHKAMLPEAAEELAQVAA
jgi:hypothetical protein